MEEQEENEKSRLIKALFFSVWIADISDTDVFFDGDCRAYE